MFSVHIGKTDRFILVVIAVLAPLLIIAMIHFLNRNVKSVYDNVLTEQLSPEVL